MKDNPYNLSPKGAENLAKIHQLLAEAEVPEPLRVHWPMLWMMERGTYIHYYASKRPNVEAGEQFDINSTAELWDMDDFIAWTKQTTTLV